MGTLVGNAVAVGAGVGGSFVAIAAFDGGSTVGIGVFVGSAVAANGFGVGRVVGVTVTVVVVPAVAATAGAAGATVVAVRATVGVGVGVAARPPQAVSSTARISPRHNIAAVTMGPVGPPLPATGCGGEEEVHACRPLECEVEGDATAAERVFAEG